MPNTATICPIFLERAENENRAYTYLKTVSGIRKSSKNKGVKKSKQVMKRNLLEFLNPINY